MTADGGQVGAQLPVAGPTQIREAAGRLIRGNGPALITMIALNALAAAAGMAGPWLVGRIVDVVKAGGGAGEVNRLALTILVCAVAQLLLARYARYVGYRFGERTLAHIREQYLDRAMALPAPVVEGAGTGDLVARGTGDVRTVAATLRDVGPEVFVATAHALFVLGAVFTLNPVLGACGLFSILGIWAATRWYLRRAFAAYLAQGAAHSALAEILAATAVGARTVEAFGLQQRRNDACRTAVDTLRGAAERTLALRSVLFPSVDIAHVVPVVAVLIVGGVLTAGGTVSLGTVVAAALYLRQLSQPLDAILERVDQLQSSAASFARVEGLATAPAPLRTAGPEPDGERVEVVNVHYAYPGRGDVLRGVDLEARPGERLALVGPSGAGKTTLGRLLAGIDAPARGSVTVGGVPVAELDPELRRRHIVLVTQEHHVFLGTVRDNLLIGRPSASDSELSEALDAVGADWVDTLPYGLDTDLGTGGVRLDGAQAQQLGLARVVLADPHLVVLDEATALLDPGTARHTEHALAAVLTGRTVIAIAHRLHTARDADRVAVMENGRLTEIGTHDELTAGGGAYARLWRSWHGQHGSLEEPG